MAHFSKYMRPGASVIGVNNPDQDLMIAAVENPDASIAVAVFNEGNEPKSFTLTLQGSSVNVMISAQALQTIIIPTN
ncbi:MAG: hypothetical protein HRU26_02375 [Psychroserpens sp.]|nr:hypothetical protein [Psychroserpens sp.]